MIKPKEYSSPIVIRGAGPVRFLHRRGWRGLWNRTAGRLVKRWQLWGEWDPLAAMAAAIKAEQRRFVEFRDQR